MILKSEINNQHNYASLLTMIEICYREVLLGRSCLQRPVIWEGTNNKGSCSFKKAWQTSIEFCI